VNYNQALKMAIDGYKLKSKNSHVLHFYRASFFVNNNEVGCCGVDKDELENSSWEVVDLPENVRFTTFLHCIKEFAGHRTGRIDIPKTLTAGSYVVTFSKE
jgi:hypothetical protein